MEGRVSKQGEGMNGFSIYSLCGFCCWLVANAIMAKTGVVCPETGAAGDANDERCFSVPLQCASQRTA